MSAGGLSLVKNEVTNDMPEFGPIGQQVFDRTYSRVKENGEKETFDEVVDRMVDGNLALVDEEFHLPTEREELKALVRDFKLVPAGRHWWVSGVPGRQFLFNCHRAGYTHRLSDHVSFTFDELMKGGGVGANYSQEYTARQVPVQRRVFVTPYIAPFHPDYQEIHNTGSRAPREAVRMTYVIPDTREGWVHAMSTLCDLAQQEGPDVELIFELTYVRERGRPINGFGGMASGPAPLWNCISAVSEILIAACGRTLTGLDMMDVDHAIASCVVSGNVRRSARMSMIHWQDPYIFDFIDVKAGGGHWTTNISVEVDGDFFKQASTKDSHADKVLQAVAAGMLRNGEPGLYNSSLASKGESGDVRCSNPCGEIALEEWENCNLGHVNLARVVNDVEMHRCMFLMTRWLLRATFSDGMSWKQLEVVARNRRIGVGILGYQEWLWTRFHCKYSESFLNHSVTTVLESAFSTVRLEADVYAHDLGVNAPIKCTTVAPTGTISQMVGATAGVHPVYARHFIRRVRYADTDPGLEAAKEQGLYIEADLNNPNTWIVAFSCADPATQIVPVDKLQQVDEIDPAILLQIQAKIQRVWADNAVSFTINLKEGQLTQGRLAGVLRQYGTQLKGTTVMVDGTYEQAPFERITREAYENGVQLVGASAPECEGACPIR